MTRKTANGLLREKFVVDTSVFTNPETRFSLGTDIEEALRTGIVDSAEDFDVVILAKEVDAVIVSEDQGIANMAGELGLEVFSGADFAALFTESENP